MAFGSAGGYGNLPNGNFVPTIYSQKVLKFFRKASVVEDITNTDYAGEIANMGDTVNIIKEPIVNVSSYVRGQQLTATDLQDNNLTLVVDHANYFMFRVDDIEQKQSHISWEPLSVSSAAYSLKNAFDQDLLSYMVGQVGSTSTYGSTTTPINLNFTGNTGSATPLNFMARLSRFLDENNVPLEGRWLVADPAFWEMMQNESSKLLDAKFTGDGSSQVRNGRILDKQIHGFTCYLSNNIPDSAGLGPSPSLTYREVLAGHMSSTATASQIAQTEVIRDPNSFADQVRGLHVYGRKVLRPEALTLGYWI